MSNTRRANRYEVQETGEEASSTTVFILLIDFVSPVSSDVLISSLSMPVPSVGMDSKARHRAREILWATYRQVEYCQSIFLSSTELQAFGVEAYQVDITDEGVLQFEPRFFDPHPAGVLQKYPINASANNRNYGRLECVPTLQDAINTVQESLPVSEDPLKVAQNLLEERLKEYHFWDDSHASWTESHIRPELRAIREGGPPFLLPLRSRLMGVDTQNIREPSYV
ncbi:uncharacterized protein N7498_006348 [Penicillium cinerascens]|uniref:Uncharacterized protein n=1 Tax=Penicillium cinerascens TaxID=70096 RepID=A0A9W9MI23_9EURO|nr:uncharacterized protein N7498_006348 [Penicillium cinerascens]KAJ5201685.1 hypothetical protein N7498_006348 [Penicillium cinerascens]